MGLWTGKQTSAEELAKVLGTNEEPYLLDVRQPEEVAAWAVPRVVNIPLGELAQRLGELPRGREIVAICASGNRSTHAAAVLARAGYDVSNLAGGMAAWSEAYDTASLDAAGGEIVQVRRRGKGCLSYLVGAGGESFVVDPSLRVDLYVDLAASRGWRITRVFDTHLHADHLSGARELAARTGASLHLNPLDPFEFDFHAIRDGERFFLPEGPEVEVSLLRTPGHTEGSVVFLVGDEALLSGDTLFVDGVGRPDLAERAEEFAHNLYRSLEEKVLVLGDEVLILPAHYSAGTAVAPNAPVAARLGDLRASLAPLSLDEADFVTWAVGAVTERPPNYVEIVWANMGRSELGPEAAASLEVGPNRCSV